MTIHIPNELSGSLLARKIGDKPVASVVTMTTSAGTDYYVHIKCGDREMTTHRYEIKGRAEYNVACWNWLFNGGEKPDILAFRTEPAQQDA